MAATTMDPVDIANILAQELLYQQVIPYVPEISTSVFRCFLGSSAKFHFPRKFSPPSALHPTCSPQPRLRKGFEAATA